MTNPLFGPLDNDIVLAVNGCHCPIMDSLVLAVTNFWFFVAVVGFLFVYSFRRDTRAKALLFCVMLLLAVGCSDYLCAGIIRPAVQQLRPTNPDNPAHTMLHIVDGYIGGRYGFPSCHAANSTAIAVFSALWFRKRWLGVALAAWALAECYTRLYLGVHYPSDIVGGAAAGSLMAFGCYRLAAIKCV